MSTLNTPRISLLVFAAAARVSPNLCSDPDPAVRASYLAEDYPERLPAGLVYPGGLVIEDCAHAPINGMRWYLQIGNVEYTSNRLDELTPHLYEYFLHERSEEADRVCQQRPAVDLPGNVAKAVALLDRQAVAAGRPTLTAAQSSDLLDQARAYGLLWHLEAEYGVDIADAHALVNDYHLEHDACSDLQRRFEDLVVVDHGSGIVLHEGLAEGAQASYFDANTGGSIWVSYHLHQAENGARLFISASADCLQVYDAPEDTLAGCIAAVKALCGEDGHLLVLVADYPQREDCGGLDHLAEIYSRYRQRKQLPHLSADEALLLDGIPADQQRWLTDFEAAWERATDAAGPGPAGGAAEVTDAMVDRAKGMPEFVGMEEVRIRRALAYLISGK